MAAGAQQKPQGTRTPAGKRARRRSADEHRVVGERHLDELVVALRSVCAEHDGVRTVLQMDFVRDRSGPRCVLRVATGPRTWMKAADGPWHDGYLQALIARDMVEPVDQAHWGTTLRALPGLLGRDQD